MAIRTRRQLTGSRFALMESLETRRMLSAAAASTTTLASSLNPVGVGQSVTFTATVTSSKGTPTGTVTFKDGSVTLGTVAVNSTTHKAILSTSASPAGSQKITAVYGGDVSFKISSSPALNETVKAGSTTTLTSSANPATPGTSITLTATVTATSGKPGGTVTFFDGSTKLGTGSVNSNTGIATFKTTMLVLGAHSLTAVYGGASSIAGSTSPVVTENINPPAATTTALTFSASNVTLGQVVTLTATVTPTGGGIPTGTVTFTSGATTLGMAAVNSSGIATLIDFAADANITATYSGDHADAASSGSNTLTGTLPSITALSDGLQVATLTAGSGPAVQAGQIVNVSYTGYLLNGTSIGTNVGGTPLPLTIGSKNNIKGFNEGIAGMKIGETRLLIIPAALAFGAAGQKPSIPPNSTIIYTIKLLSLVPRMKILGGTGFSLAVPLNGTPSAANGTDFGSVHVNTLSTPSAFAVLNADPNFNLTFKGVFANSDTKDFIVTQPTFINGTYTFFINFKPFNAGVKTATITIPTSDTDVPSFTFTVTGVGI